MWVFQSRFWHSLLQYRDAGVAQPVQTRVPVLVQEEAEQIVMEDIVAGVLISRCLLSYGRCYNMIQEMRGDTEYFRCFDLGWSQPRLRRLIWIPPPALFIIIATTSNNAQILRYLAHCKRLFKHNRLVLVSSILAGNSLCNGHYNRPITAGVT